MQVLRVLGPVCKYVMGFTANFLAINCRKREYLCYHGTLASPRALARARAPGAECGFLVMKRMYARAPHPPDLAAARQRKGISLHDIADTTKISVRFLQAIEEGDFKTLPGGIYDRSYIRQYANAVGVADTDLLEYYRSVTAEWD